MGEVGCSDEAEAEEEAEAEDEDGGEAEEDGDRREEKRAASWVPSTTPADGAVLCSSPCPPPSVPEAAGMLST